MDELLPWRRASSVTQQLRKGAQVLAARFGPSDVVRNEVDDDRLSAHLTRLRLKIEAKTEKLNDRAFEVTESWLLEFADQHAEYMEKGGSGKASKHQFRSTMDLFHHVLQHPAVYRMLESWQQSGHTLESKRQAGASRSTKSEVSASNRGLPSSQSSQPRRWSEGPPTRKRVVAASTLPTSRKDGSTPHAIPEGFKCTCAFHMAQTREAMRHPSRIRDNVRDNVHVTATPESQGKTDEIATTPVQPALKNEGHRSKSDSLSRSADVTSPAAARCRRGFVQTLSTPEKEDGELVRKVRQRGKWQGLSPRSRRLAEAAAAGQNDGHYAPDKLAARRELLESRLASCGFQKAACVGGA